MNKQPTIWERQPHTAAKHAILKSYLGAWFPKLAWSGRVVFIDGFAGPGEYKGGEPGSPVIAVTTAVDHKGDLSSCELFYIFVERDKKRYAHLVQLLKTLPTPSNIKVQVELGDFADKLGEILDILDSRGRSLAPSLIMADPFGFTGVPFDLIARAAQQPRSEFLISFMYESVSRFLDHPDHEKTFDLLFGCSAWKDANACATPDEKKRFLLDLYENQLRAAGLTYVRAFEMMDKGNRTEYFLIFATHSLVGLKAMKAAMWTADPTGQFQFSDAKATGQMMLIAPEPDFTQLKNLLVTKFQGVPTRVEEIEEFVLVETIFRESHYKKTIFGPMELAGELEVLDSPRKRNWGYPDGTVILIR